MSKEGVVLACFREIPQIMDFDRFHRYNFDLLCSLGTFFKWLQTKNGCKLTGVETKPTNWEISKGRGFLQALGKFLL